MSEINSNGGCGGIIGGFQTGSVDHAYNIGTLKIVNTGGSTPTNSKNVTETEMKGWEQSTINTNLPNFLKKEKGLPILNITVRNVTF